MTEHLRSGAIGTRKAVLISAMVAAGLIAAAAFGEFLAWFMFAMAICSAVLAVPVVWALEKLTGVRPAYRTVFLALFGAMTIPLLFIFAFVEAWH